MYPNHNIEGSFISQEEAQLAAEHNVDARTLKWRKCTICGIDRNCFNGWCGKCLSDYRAALGRWPCQAKK